MYGDNYRAISIDDLLPHLDYAFQIRYAHCWLIRRRPRFEPRCYWYNWLLYKLGLRPPDYWIVTYRFTYVPEEYHDEDFYP